MNNSRDGQGSCHHASSHVPNRQQLRSCQWEGHRLTDSLGHSVASRELRRPCCAFAPSKYCHEHHYCYCHFHRCLLLTSALVWQFVGAGTCTFIGAGLVRTKCELVGLPAGAVDGPLELDRFGANVGSLSTPRVVLGAFKRFAQACFRNYAIRASNYSDRRISLLFLSTL